MSRIQKLDGQESVQQVTKRGTKVKSKQTKEKKEDLYESVIINVKYCEYQIVKDVAKEYGYIVSTNDKADYDIMWVDLICTGEFIS